MTLVMGVRGRVLGKLVPVSPVSVARVGPILVMVVVTII